MRRLISIMLWMSTCAIAAPYGQPVVKRDSEVVREIYRQPLTAETFPLLAARETLELAEDRKAVNAIDAHLGRMGVALLTGAPVPVGGAIGDLLDPTKARAPDPPEAIARILSSSLRAKVDHVESIRIHASIENAGPRAFRLFDSTLQLRPGPGSIDMTCHAGTPSAQPLQPGESRLYECGVSGNSYGLEDYFRDFAKANAPGAELPIRATRIEFVDPPVSVSTTGVSWHDRESARSQTIISLREVTCEKRGACADAFWRHLTDRPHYLAALIGGACGLVAAAAIAFTTRRRGRAAGIASALGLAASVAIGAVGGASLGGAMGMLILGFLALVGLGAYLLALWISVAVFGVFRRSNV